jgi:hypothetical protein
MRKTRQNRPSTSRLPSLLFNKTFFSTILLRKLFIRLFSRPEKAPQKIRCHLAAIIAAATISAAA